MKTRFALGLLLFRLVLATGVTGRAQTSRPRLTSGANSRSWSLMSWEGNNSRYYNTFNRIARVFTEVFEARKWPVKINVERFGCQLPDARDRDANLTSKASAGRLPSIWSSAPWMTLDDHGKKQDFGVIRYRLQPASDGKCGDQLESNRSRGPPTLPPTKDRNLSSSHSERQPHP